MLRFEFQAKSLHGGADSILVIEIASPRPVEGFPNDYECPIRFTGVVNKAMRGVGAFPLQAVDLSIQIAKAVAGSYSDEWEFQINDQGPIPFSY